MVRWILPLFLSGVPWESQNSMRLPVPVWVFTMMSLTSRRSRGSAIPSQPLFYGPVNEVSSLQR